MALITTDYNDVSVKIMLSCKKFLYVLLLNVNSIDFFFLHDLSLNIYLRIILFVCIIINLLTHFYNSVLSLFLSEEFVTSAIAIKF